MTGAHAIDAACERCQSPAGVACADLGEANGVMIGAFHKVRVLAASALTRKGNIAARKAAR